MPTNKKLLIGGSIALALGAIWAFRKKTAIENLAVDVSNLKVAYKSTAFQISLDLIVTNPSDELLKFQSFTGNIYNDGQVLGSIDIANAVNINPKSKTSVPLAAVIPLSNIANTLLSVLTDKKLPTSGTLKGTVTLSGGISIPVFYTFTFGAPAAVPATSTTVATKVVTTTPIKSSSTPAASSSPLTALQKQLADAKTALANKKASNKLAKQTAKIQKKLSNISFVGALPKGWTSKQVKEASAELLHRANQYEVHSRKFLKGIVFRDDTAHWNGHAHNYTVAKPN